jgi:hypothetical protein
MLLLPHPSFLANISEGKYDDSYDTAGKGHGKVLAMTI